MALPKIDYLGLYGIAVPEIEQLEARIEALEAALRECAATFATSPGTVGQCQSEISAEFQRRMNIAAETLAALNKDAG